MTPEEAAAADLRPGDELFRLPVGEYAVLVRVRAGEPTLMSGTSCDLVSAVPLPQGWQGVCLEYTDHGRRVFGTFPYVTTCRYGLPRTWTAPEFIGMGERHHHRRDATP
jgi:hypothetical protein